MLSPLNGQNVVYIVVSSSTTVVATDSMPLTSEHLWSEQLVMVITIVSYSVLVIGVDNVVGVVVDASTSASENASESESESESDNRELDDEYLLVADDNVLDKEVDVTLPIEKLDETNEDLDETYEIGSELDVVELLITVDAKDGFAETVDVLIKIRKQKKQNIEYPTQIPIKVETHNKIVKTTKVCRLSKIKPINGIDRIPPKGNAISKNLLIITAVSGSK